MFNLYNDRWPVFTLPRRRAAGEGVAGPGGEPSYVDGSLLCEGSIVSGAHVERSIVAPGVYVDHDAHVTDSILFPGVRVGPGARLHRCIVDKNVDVPGVVPRRPRRRTIDRERFTSATTASPSSRRTAELDRRVRAEATQRLGRSGAGELGDDGGEGVDVVAADDDVAEAELARGARRRSSAIDAALPISANGDVGDHRRLDADRQPAMSPSARRGRR